GCRSWRTSTVRRPSTSPWASPIPRPGGRWSPARPLEPRLRPRPALRPGADAGVRHGRRRWQLGGADPDRRVAIAVTKNVLGTDFATTRSLISPVLDAL
ncbi:MAG: hypothetical protein ACRDQ0_20205, partial [Pseudonocardia sp.]